MEVIIDKKPLVSAIINTYNYGCYIEEAIDSVISQTFPLADLEIIVVDDGSQDDTPQRVKKYGDKIRYIYKENGGQASALNAGFENSRGKIIAFLDGDDHWYPDKLEHVVEEFEKSDSVDVVYHYMNLVDDNRQVIGLLPDPKIEDEIHFEKHPLESYLKGVVPFCVLTAAVAVRRDCFRKISPIPLSFRLYPDLYIELTLPFFAREFALVKRYLGNHRIHTNNTWMGKESGKELQIQRTNLEIKLISFLAEHIDELARERGYDSALLKKKFGSLILEREILLHNLEGEKFKALKKALLFHDPALRDSVLYRAFKKLSMLMSIAVPYSRYVWLRQKYGSSFVFRFVHGFLK